MTATPPERALAEADLGATKPGRVLRVAEKSLLALGTHDGAPVVIKLLLDEGDYWRDRFSHEIGIYRAFQHTPPPVPVPRLVHTDNARVLVIEHLNGEPLDTNRYPTRPMPAAAVHAALEAVTAFNAWNPPAPVLAPAWDYHERVRRYHHGGWFTDHERAALEALLPAAGPPTQPNHGDPLPANLLLTPHGCAMVDFEWSGLYLPGLDLALLHALLCATPAAQSHIDTLVRHSGHETAFLVNQAVVLARERRIHTELRPGQFRDHQMRLLAAQWATVHDRLLAAAQPGGTSP